MPLTSSLADALGVLTIILVAVLILLALFSLIYSTYFHIRIRSLGTIDLNYFSGPWIIRIVYLLFALWWCLGEIFRLRPLRRSGRLLGSLSLEWQENICKCYIVSNLGFAEPCLLLTLIFLLRASLQKFAPLSQNWNGKTAVHVLLFGFPMLILQLLVILIEPKFRHHHKLPSYFIEAASSNPVNGVAFCTYPLLSTIFLGLFDVMLTCYLLWLGKRILHRVINKSLRRRAYTLILSNYGLFPLRVLLLGLSVLPRAGSVAFDAVVFVAFVSLFCCMLVGICLLVYLPAADSLSLRNLQRQDIEEATRTGQDHNDSMPLIPCADSPGRDSSFSAIRGSISFRSMARDDGGFVELSLFATSPNSSPPDSPRPIGWRRIQQEASSS